MSSSGFVPGPSSKRETNEYGPSQALIRIVPLPSSSEPSHCASAVLTGMAASSRQLLPDLTPDRDVRGRPPLPRGVTPPRDRLLSSPKPWEAVERGGRHGQ